MTKVQKSRGRDRDERFSGTQPPAGGERQPLFYLTAALQGVGRRERQEDALAFGNADDAEAIREKGLLCVVADGMGGLEGGSAASETAVASLLRSFGLFDREGDIPGQLESAVCAANTEVYRRLGGRGGSTVIAGMIYGERLWFTSVGDSYLFLLRDCRLYRLNRSQNVLNREWLDAIRDGELDPYSALRNPEKEAITQFLGMEELDELDSLRRPLELRAGDVLLFCSDGVGGVLPTSCLEECLGHGRPEDMVKAMDREIRRYALSYQDNYTALVVQCRG